MKGGYMNYLAQIEALLFVAGEEGLSLRDLADMVHVPPTGLQQQVDKLAQKYDGDKTSSLCLLETAGRYKIVTKEAFADLLREFSKAPVNQSLSRASLEVLSIIAYKQPITRIEVDDIRGVNSSSAISKLMVLGLIVDAGKKDVIGRPNLYVTTDYFLDFMGINDLSQLVDVSNIELFDEEINLFTLPDSLEEDLQDKS